MNIPPPRKKPKVLMSAQVQEHEIGLTYEEYECPRCAGSGEEYTDYEGIDSYELCPDCDGSGTLYLSIKN